MDAEDYSFYLAYCVLNDEDLQLQDKLDEFFVVEDTISQLNSF